MDGAGSTSEEISAANVATNTCRAPPCTVSSGPSKSPWASGSKPTSSTVSRTAAARAGSSGWSRRPPGRLICPDHGSSERSWRRPITTSVPRPRSRRQSITAARTPTSESGARPAIAVASASMGGNSATPVRYRAMERLWAPWRLQYVKSAAGENEIDCVFCAKQGVDDHEALVVHRGERCFVMLNLYPYTNGHLMVAPYRHLAKPGDLDADERAELWELLARSLDVLDVTLKPHGANAGLNLGRPAGAGVEGHLHLHVVPRWNGDVNFMPVLADVRVMAQHLDDTWELLRDAWSTV